MSALRIQLFSIIATAIIIAIAIIVFICWNACKDKKTGTKGPGTTGLGRGESRLGTDDYVMREVWRGLVLVAAVVVG